MDNIKDIIIETDVGHDPDDVFAILYLHSAGVNIRAITVHKGAPHQLALIRFMCKELGLDIPVGATSLDVPQPKKYSGGFEGRPIQEYVGFHYKLLEHYGYPYEAKSDMEGYKVIADTLQEYPDAEIFVIGAPKNLSTYLKCPKAKTIQRVTFQGGFIGYHVHNMPCKRLSKFEGKTTFPSFNPNGDVKGTQLIVETPLIKNLRFVSKNVCHTVVYNKDIHELMEEALPKNRADEIFLKGMDIYLDRHSEKKFHDPVAAVCMLHPEIAQWVRGTLYRENGGWGTRLDPTSNSETIVSLDENEFWDKIIDK